MQGYWEKASARVSPEFMLRPSLSAMQCSRVRSHPPAGVAGVYAPAFVERGESRCPPRRTPSGVAGVYAPAFVERYGIAFNPGPHCDPVSPEFMLRPSLSAGGRARGRENRFRGVAGVYAPAFVERTTSRCASASRLAVSPEFMLRPSLSGSGGARTGRHRVGGVAGVYAPAFVERLFRLERFSSTPITVSPEFMLRPSLSAPPR